MGPQRRDVDSQNLEILAPKLKDKQICSKKKQKKHQNLELLLFIIVKSPNKSQEKVQRTTRNIENTIE